MNGVQKDSFLRIVEDKEAGGLIWDALSEIHGVVKNQPAKCDKRFLKRKHAIYAGIAIVFLLIGAGLLQIDTIAALIP